MTREWISIDQSFEKVIDYRGKTPRKLNSSWSDSGYRVLSALNVKANGLIKEDSIKYADENLYQKWMKEEIRRGDILLTSEAPAGQAMVWDSNEKIVLGQRLFALRLNDKFDNYFLKYFLQSEVGQHEIMRNTSGSTVFGISAKMFRLIKIPKLEKTTQELISNFLLQLDRRISLNNKINTELEELAKTTYEYWFVQFDFPDKNGKPYKSSGGKMVWNEELKREIPEGWQSTILGKHIEFQRGISYTKKSISEESGVPLINLNSFNINGSYKTEGIKMYSGKYKEAALLDTRDLVIAITDVTRNADIIGRGVLVPDVFDGKSLMSCDVAKVITDDKLSVHYLKMLFNSDNFHEYIKYFATGTLVLHLNLDGVKWFKTVLPPQELQDKFAEFVESLTDQLVNSRKQDKELSELRDFLLPMLMNGQVTIR